MHEWTLTATVSWFLSTVQFGLDPHGTCSWGTDKEDVLDIKKEQYKN